MENKRKWLVMVIIILMVFILNSCDGNNENPISCQCPNEATHLEVGASNVTCPADNCPHTDDCTEKVNQMLGNGTTKIVKSVGVEIDAFNSMISNFNILANSSNEVLKNSFANNITEVMVLTGSGISHQGKIVSVGSDTYWGDVASYLLTEGIVSTVAQIQHQTKTQWLASNKGRELVC